MPRSGLLRIREACEFLGMSRTKVHQLTRSGQIPVVMLGRTARIPATALDEWIERQTQHFG